MPDVVVVGGGPAGLSAAAAARNEGAEVLVVERDDRLGGVLRQCIHDGFGILEYGERLTGPEYAHRQAALIGPHVSVMKSAFLYSLEPNDREWRIELVTEHGVVSVSAPSVVMATGCRERTDRQIYLHGDRPAGIFTAGQAQRLINLDGIMPGRDVVILGSGDIGLIMARRFVLEGARVRGVYEIGAQPSGLARNISQCLEDWDIPLNLSMTVTEVHGRDRIHAVTVCPVDAKGRPDHGAAELVECDTLVLSVGLIPENDLVEDMGVILEPSTGGPAVTQDRRTEREGLFVCGNALTVYDLVDYVSECGRAAGTAAAVHARGPLRGAGSRPRWPRDTVRVLCGTNIAQVVPQELDPAAEAPPVFFLRVRQPGEGMLLSLRNGTDSIATRRLAFARPAEMIRYQVPEGAWAKIRRSQSPVSVDVVSADGE